MSIYFSSHFLRYNRLFYSKCSRGTSFLLIRNSNTVNASVSTHTKHENQVKNFENIPGPPKIPILGTMLNFVWRKGRRPLVKFLLDMQFEGVQEYGRISKVYVPGISTPVIQLADPTEVHKLFQSEPKYPKRIDMPIIENFLKDRNKTKGVFFADGNEWHRHRSVISKRMLLPKELVSYSPILNDVVTDFMTRFEQVKAENIGSEYQNEVKELNKELFKWSFESVCYFVLERRLGCLEDEMNQDAQNLILAVNGFLSSIFPVSLFPVSVYKYYKTKPYKQFIESLENMYEYAELFIDRKVEELVQHGKLKNEGGSPQENVEERSAGFFEFLIANGKLSREDITASVIDLLFAGIETTSNTILWALYMLGKNPEKQEILYQEVTSVLKPGELPSAETFANTPYLKAWIKETFRLYPVLPTLVRVVQEDLVLMGYHIPAGTHVNMLHFFMGRDENSFKDATKFIPERWLRDPDNNTPGVPHSFASLPFGFGKRMCVGRRIAELEMHLLLSRIVRDYQVSYPHADEVEPEVQGAVVPDRPVRVKFIKRKSTSFLDE